MLGRAGHSVYAVSGALRKALGSKECYVIARMLADGEEAKARGKQKVQYYEVSEVLAGVIARPEE